VTIAFNLAVVVPAYRLGFPAPHALLALSPGVGAYVNVWMLHRRLVARGVLSPAAHWPRLLRVQLPAANLAMAVFLWFASGDWGGWIGAPSWLQICRLALCVLGGGGVYAAVLWLTGVRWRDLRAV